MVSIISESMEKRVVLVGKLSIARLQDFGVIFTVHYLILTTQQ